jgi:hypothetical protein
VAFNALGKQSVPLDQFGGLVTEAPPEGLPEGSSPLTWDTDFVVAGVLTRPGLQSVLSSGQSRNFVWVKTFIDNSGVVRTLALDATGDLWLENVSSTPGTLSSIFNVLSGDLAHGSTAFGREYICLTGSDMPRQYDGTNLDRISQEGPGGNAAYNVTSANPNSATITSFAITSNVVTFQAANSFASGTIVTISGLSVGTYLNGVQLTVIATGLSTSQFEADFTHADVTSTVDSGTATVVTSFAISSITQPAQHTVTSGGGTGAIWTAGPQSSANGNVVSIFYSTSTADSILVNEFTKGIPVYVYLTFSGTGPFSTLTGTYLVTSIGHSGWSGSGSAKSYFFTVVVATTNSLQSADTITYQMSLATVTTTTPVPGLVVGGQVSIQGATPTAWNNTWSVVDTAAGGFMDITATSAASNIASYTFSLISGSAPVVGDLVTVTNTTNDNGRFNVVNAPIATVVGSTFTITNFVDQTVASQAESGSAQTFGSIFNIDPGPLFVGGPGSASPIYGNDTGTGTVTALGTTLSIGAGTRQAVVMFLTRNGALTKPSPPVTFTTSGEQSALTVSNLPIGPPDVIARWVAITEAGANGIPGAFFYVIPVPVQSIVNGQPFTYTSTVVNDNTSTSATFVFTDAVLLSSLEIDIAGGNQFNLGELGSSTWNINYASRMFYGLEQNKVTNFNNLSFNGGYQLGNLFPLGWTADATNGGGASLIVSSYWSGGNSLYIQNTTGSTAAKLGMITQNAFQDALAVPILLPNTTYSVRLMARIPSGTTTGNLVIDLTEFDTTSGYKNTWGTFTLPFSSLSTTMQAVSGTLLTTAFTTVPSDLLLRVFTTSIANNADIEVEHIEIYPTDEPVLNTQLKVSYVNNPEAFDLVTGVLGVAGTNRQPVNGAFVMYDTLYLLKSGSLFSTRDSPGEEPAFWRISEVSNRVGACGPNAYDVGEEWAVMASRNGLYVFFGQQPVKVNQEIWQIWEALNWSAASTFWVRNDIVNRRILVGVALPTPNKWLPHAPTNASPTTPNVVLMLNYLGLGTVQALADEPQMHVTMFGNLVSVDMRRKWSIWQIASPFADFVTRADLVSEPLLLCNGNGSGKIYQLSATQYSDDGTAINGLYTTYGFVGGQQSKQNPLLGFHRKLYTYLQLVATGSGTLAISALSNMLTADANHTYTVPYGIPLSTAPADDYERPLNVAGNRVFLQFSTNAAGAWFQLSKLILVGGMHPALPLRGSASP